MHLYQLSITIIRLYNKPSQTQGLKRGQFELSQSCESVI